MELVTFLQTVITAEKGWFCLATARIEEDETTTQKSWEETFYSWPDELPKIIDAIRNLPNDCEVYFSPYLFEHQKSTKEEAIVGRTVVADLDEASILTLQIKPSILVETSPDRHQGYWILSDQLSKEEHERISKKLTYSIPRCDKTGWFIGKKVRVPETFNNKYKSGPKPIRIVDTNSKVYESTELDSVSSTMELFGQAVVDINEEDLGWAEKALVQTIGPQEMLSSVRSSIAGIYSRYNLLSNDRSAALWALTMSLFRAGLSKDKVLFIAYHSVNNKFKDLRYGGLKELAKDVLRAELATKAQIPDIKEKVRNARRLGDNTNDRAEYIAKIASDYLKQIGNFIHCQDESLWYIRHDTGRPIQINTRNDPLNNMLDNLFGVNAAEPESRYIGFRLRSEASELPVTARICKLSSYDHNARMFVLHTGRKELLVVTREHITVQNNGYAGLIFPWNPNNTVIYPKYESLDEDWDVTLFGDCFYNVLSLSKDEAQAILKVWFISVLLRDGLSSRPILALYGAPGSGKSTLFRRVFLLLYGKERGIGTVTKEDSFDHAMSIDPLVVLDNADSYVSWLPDRLAATVAPTDIIKRKLYTDNETVIIKRDAMLGITAHNPKFGREDVTDRLLLLTFERLSDFKSDSEILSRIERNRNGIWGAVLQDIQKVLGTDMPKDGYPEFRVKDFAIYGMWIASALGIGQLFKNGLQRIRQDQRSYNLEEDMILLDALDKLLETKQIENMTAGQLWNSLSNRASDQRTFQKRYGNAVSLGRKLGTLLDSMREWYDVDWTVRKGSRVWSIRRKAEVGVNGTT